jgi:acid phosphatase (class A)
MSRSVYLVMSATLAAGLAAASMAQAAPTATDPGAAAIAAAEPSPPAPLPQKPAHVLKYLSPDDLNPATLLAPPPANGSDQQKAEVSEVLHMQQIATQARRNQAIWDDRHENSQLWIPTLGPSGFDLAKLPATMAMLDAVMDEREAAADIFKVYFDRRRPWTFNDAIQSCEAAGKNGSKVRSYPSGHGTLSYAQGVILAHLMPSKGQIIMARAEDFAESRMICGVHSRSDIRASAILGTTIGMLLLHNNRFKLLLDASHAELAAAFLTR